METNNTDAIEGKINEVLALLEGLSFDVIHEILREATHKARKQSVLTKVSPSH